jgi:hypothetical protein
MSLFPNEDSLTREIESWKAFVDSLSSKEGRELFENMLMIVTSMLLQQELMQGPTISI